MNKLMMYYKEDSALASSRFHQLSLSLSLCLLIMSLKKVFTKFIGTVLLGMEKSVDAKNLKESEKFVFEWKKLGHVGATGVAEHLQEKHGLEASPTVVGDGEETIPVFSVSHDKFTHEFHVGESRYRYMRVNGKAKEMSKEYSALMTEFWAEFGRKQAKIAKRVKAKATKERDDASYEISLEIQKEKKEAEKKDEEEAKKKEAEKKEEEEAKKKEEEAKKEETPPKEKPSPETPPPQTPPSETPLPVTGAGKPLPEE